MSNNISLVKENTPNFSIESIEILENHQKFIAYEMCLKCGGCKWSIGFPPTTEKLLCFCLSDIQKLPIGWICPKCQKVLAPGIIEHICDHF